MDQGAVTNSTAQFYRVDRLPNNFASDNAGDTAYNVGWSNFSGGGHGFEYYNRLAPRAVQFLADKLDEERRRVV